MKDDLEELIRKVELNYWCLMAFMGVILSLLALLHSKVSLLYIKLLCIEDADPIIGLLMAVMGFTITVLSLVQVFRYSKKKVMR